MNPPVRPTTQTMVILAILATTALLVPLTTEAFTADDGPPGTAHLAQLGMPHQDQLGTRHLAQPVQPHQAQLGTPTPNPTPEDATPVPLFLPLLRTVADTSGGVGQREYAVYDAVIEHEYDLHRLERLVIRDHTEGWWISNDMRQHLEENLPGLEDDTFESFVAQNEENQALQDRFRLDTEVVLIGDAEIDELFGGEIDGWETFYARYPGSQGIMGLSRVGFSADGTQALLYLGNQWHWLAGRGYVWLLSRVGGGWVVERGAMVWIS